MSREKLPVHLENREQVGAKLVSPSAQRNSGPIADVLSPLITANGRVLEIASGTGQHGAHMCGARTDIHWQMTDIDAPSRASQNAYRQDFPDRMPKSYALNMTEENWWQQSGSPDVLYCANMVHISPWDATRGLAKGAKALLGTDGLLCLYGPFLFGKDSAASNLNFDASLKRRNSAWGVRSLEAVKHIFADRGLNLHSAIEMPRDNMFLVFKPA